MIFSGTTGSRTIQFVQSARLEELAAIPFQFNSGSQSFITISGATFSQSTGATRTNYQMQAFLVGGAQTTSVSWSSSNTGVGAIDSNGFLSYVSDGQTNITAEFSRDSATTGITFQTQTGVTVRTLSSYQEGTLANNATTGIDALLMSEKQTDIYSVRNNETATYTRNTGFWGSGINLSCVSVWNSQEWNPRRGGVLISPRHVLFSAHYPIFNQNVLRFVNNQNQVFSGVVSGTAFHPNYDALNLKNDIQIAVLTQDITGVSFAKIMPVFSGKHVTEGFNRNIASFIVDSERKALVYDYGFTDQENFAYFTNPVSINKEIRKTFSEGIVAGDSGSPAFFLLNGEPVLIGAASYGGATSMQCSFLGGQISAINSMMSGLGGGYQVSAFNISGFNSI
jgi:hypothetical protein